ncbi:hypothetical protein FHS61_000474 [Altererythrobacter atlanticus]|uniref:Uncharacterized protein n=2 Tax=Croceibacterium atlanticum TaxID=1267766 RepID=A0A0F7KSZ1_9SPHN|nr:alpha/beta hydrolase [Croceibacterium atlanticum]AKH42704.1 hypothetical protein WYH_01668 [Croceibacterium atlanticum]MBB5731481.1 hypothetical protein [Croceibacterium atlanticum]
MERRLRLVAIACACFALPGAAHAMVEKGQAPAPPPVAVEVPAQPVVAPAGQALASRYYIPDLAAAADAAIAEYGPFRVLDERTAALVDVTDRGTPASFAAMLRDFPSIEVLEFHDCPGTYDDIANLRLGRMIRAAGLRTFVAEGGSVRSGAVELFLAGESRVVADGAEFAVHAWIDVEGLEPDDFAADSPQNRKYLSYYREMGMSAEEAASFYTMTNSASFENALWLTGSEMRQWVEAEKPAAPKLAYLDFASGLN